MANIWFFIEYWYEYWQFIIPLIIVQLGLMTAALIHIFKHKTDKLNNRVFWVIACIAINILGSLCYFYCFYIQKKKSGK